MEEGGRGLPGAPVPAPTQASPQAVLRDGRAPEDIEEVAVCRGLCGQRGGPSEPILALHLLLCPPLSAGTLCSVRLTGPAPPALAAEAAGRSGGPGAVVAAAFLLQAGGPLWAAAQLDLFWEVELIEMMCGRTLNLVPGHQGSWKGPLRLFCQAGEGS